MSAKFKYDQLIQQKILKIQQFDQLVDQKKNLEVQSTLQNTDSQQQQTPKSIPKTSQQKKENNSLHDSFNFLQLLSDKESPTSVQTNVQKDKIIVKNKQTNEQPIIRQNNQTIEQELVSSNQQINEQTTNLQKNQIIEQPLKIINQPKNNFIYRFQSFQECMMNIHRLKYGLQRKLGMAFLCDCLIQLQIVESNNSQYDNTNEIEFSTENNHLVYSCWLIAQIIIHGQDKTNRKWMMIDEIFCFLNIILQSVKEVLQKNNSSLKLQQHLNEINKSQKKYQYFESVQKLNKFLVEKNILSFDCLITKIKNIIVTRNNCEFYTFLEQEEEEEKMKSTRKTQDSIYSEGRNQQQMGTMRSILLYEHSKKLKLKQSIVTPEKKKMPMSENGFFDKNNRSLTPQKPDQTVFERLLAKQKSKIKINKNQYDFTYTPLLTPSKKDDQVKVNQISGVNKTLDRMKSAQLIKEQRESFFETQQEILKVKYSSKAVIKPFKMLINKVQTNEPFLYLDVEIRKGKMSRIGIRKEDNIDSVINIFSMTYQLKEDQKNKLITDTYNAIKTYYQQVIGVKSKY